MMISFLLLCFVSFALSSSAVPNGSLGDPALNASESDIRLFYYSKKYPDGKEITHDKYEEAIEDTDFDKSKRTVFTVHGWHNNNSSPFSSEVREAFLAQHDINVFVIDWNKIARQPYIFAFASVHEIANILGLLIDSLISHYGLDLDNTIIIGHSLGAHVAGLAGAKLNGKVGTIIGLDPALPGYSKENIYERLDETDAKFVHVVHSCQGLAGVNYNVGHADYFANDGRNQPGCFMDLIGTCAHSRAFLYFCESLISGNFKSYQCDSYANFKSGACDGNKVSYMGNYDIDKTASGTYYFETNSSPPYAKS